MPRWLAETFRHPVRPLASVALLALVPKCGVCVLAYVGLGALLGLRGPEICGGTAGGRGSWACSLAMLGIALGIIGLSAGLRGRRSSGQKRRSCP